MANVRFILMFLFSLLSIGPAIAMVEMRDPTRPIGDNASVSFAETYELGSILFSVERKIAVINGQWLRVGDKVDGVTVTRIEKNSVDIDGPGGKQTLTLLTQPKK